ncbi:hypothetical protein [Streptomyces barringtoniae]|uniref:hypothetical protein n=1 Tax=Streptomyces barringtoniae TaxID=2892029 RepID=UPI001E41736B|nr:hypothetical protein [Streptomyces barringtoniae]MCC5479619.1 hypothetical protein [Streptomyces barringtoniae]
MPRGRHRHSPPLHRLLPPSAIAAVSVVCALGPWVFSEAMVVRALAAVAAATAVVGAVVMRRWDAQAGKRVAELTRARAGDEWRYEERVAELETDLEESRELRTKLEQRLRAKRAELAGLRNEHAALLRRYATAETERATALEGRRLLEIEAAAPSPALPPARRAELESEPESAEVKAAEEPAADAAGAGADPGDEPKARAVFSPEGARLYQRALTAMARFGGDATSDSATDAAAFGDTATPASSEAAACVDTAPKAATSEAGEPDTGGEARAESGAVPKDRADVRRSDVGEAGSAAQTDGAPEGVTDATGAPAGEAGAPAAQEDEAQGQPEAAGGHARAAAAPMAPAEPAQPVGRPPAGHFTVPTAVAVVPAAPARRPVVEGGFDFFGTQKDTQKDALDSVQNEDLADVVGQEALAVHKAETEAEFKDADARSEGVGQVIDLTAHDETEQIDVQRLRSAAS